MNRPNLSKVTCIMLLINGLLLASCKTEFTPNIEENGILPLESTNYHLTLSRASTSEAQVTVMNNGLVFHGIEMPVEVMLNVFSRLPLPTIACISQVCQHWHRLSEEPVLWRSIMYGNYPASEATEGHAKLHILRVYVNIISDLAKIEYLVSKYQLNKRHPFARYHAFLGRLEFTPAMTDAQAAQGNQEALINKIKDLASIPTSSPPKFKQRDAVILNDALASQGNEWAIERKIEGLVYGWYGYPQDAATAIAYNEDLADQGNKGAIERKIGWLTADSGYTINRYGISKQQLSKPEEAYHHFYEQDNKKTIVKNMQWLTYSSYIKKRDIIKLNETLCEQGDEKAINRKIQGLAKGEYGYKKNPKAAVAYIETLVEQGVEAAMHIKLCGLTFGTYGYEKNPELAFALNEYWIEQGNEKAIERKIDGLLKGNYGYKYNREAAIILIEELIKQGNKMAIDKKMTGLFYGWNGYFKNLADAFAFTEQLIEQGNEDAIIWKIGGLLNGNRRTQGYEQDPIQLKRYIEEEAAKDKRWACYLKAQGLKYGILGFEKDLEAAIQYVKQYSIPY